MVASPFSGFLQSFCLGFLFKEQRVRRKHGKFSDALDTPPRTAREVCPEPRSVSKNALAKRACRAHNPGTQEADFTMGLPLVLR